MTNEPLTYTATPGQHEGTTILKLTGPLTLSSMFSFQQEFRRMKPPVLIVDLSESEYMDSAGLGLLINQQVSADSEKRKFALAAVNERIKALLEMTRVTDVVKTFPTVADAEAALV